MAKQKRPRDPNQLAWQIVQEATGQAEKPAEMPDTRNPAAVALSKLGASKGGHVRAAALSASRRSAVAKKGRRRSLAQEAVAASVGVLRGPH